MQNVFITGANRGLGLALAHQFVANGDHVYATARQPEQATDLQTLAGDNLTVLQLDVGDEASIASCAKALKSHTDSLDVLINNAGINPRGVQTFADVDAQTMMDVFYINAVAPLMVVRGLVDFLKNGTNSRIVNVSSQMGSMDWMTRGGAYAYSPSKAGLNMVTRSMATDLKAQGITTITLHPGWVQTDMGGPNASITPQESAEGIFKLTQRLTAEDNGNFFKWNGDPHPW